MNEPATDRSAVFEEQRPLLLSLAYRMLGSVMDAEDMVQEAFLRWQHADGPPVASARAYLTTILTRLCIDYLRSARVRREQYVGIWLPEPLLTDDEGDPAEASVLQESISFAFLVLLESLTPSERACFLLREVFGFGYGEIAAIVAESEENCRQMVSRARRRVSERRPRFSVASADHERLAAGFLRACTEGDTGQLLAILSEDVVSYSDGGGRASAALNPVRGSDRVARLFLGLMRKAPDGLEVAPITLNGRPALVTTFHDQPVNVVCFDIADGRIQNVYIVVNPDKLRSLTRRLPAQQSTRQR